MKLSNDQLQALEVLKAGNNAFITGEAGSGKSFILDYYSKYSCSNKHIAKCAYTALAVLNLAKDKDSDICSTIHSLFKITGPDVISPRKYIDRSLAKDIAKYDVIIIDEISMVRIDIFSYISAVIAKANNYRDSDIQLIVVGDFYQLPPIIDNKQAKLINKYYDTDSGFAFESEYWNLWNFQVINLTYNFRQTKDKVYLKHLQNIRKGINLDKTLSFFNKSLTNDLSNRNDTIGIFPTNIQVNKYNKLKLSKLKGKITTICAYHDNEIRHDIKHNILDSSNLPASLRLELKPKALVMFIRNDKIVKDKARRYVNGDLATVISCEEKQVVVRLLKNNKLVHLHKYNCSYPVYKPVKDILGIAVQDEYAGLYKQYPLTLAYGLTIHKAQGKTLPAIIFDPKGSEINASLVYTALSRVKCMDDLQLLHPLTLDQIKVNDKVINFYNIIENNTDALFDVVFNRR